MFVFKNNSKHDVPFGKNFHHEPDSKLGVTFTKYNRLSIHVSRIKKLRTQVVLLVKVTVSANKILPDVTSLSDVMMSITNTLAASFVF